MNHNETCKSNSASINDSNNTSIHSKTIEDEIILEESDYHNDSSCKRSFALSEFKNKCYIEECKNDDDYESSSSSSEIASFHHTKNLKNTKSVNKDICILGKQYSSLNDYTSIRSDEKSLFWFTYRRDFPELVPYGLTTDAGWGCMLRATQMMLCQALRLHYVGRDWRPPIQRRNDGFVYSVMNWFADHPGSDCPFSLHNMIAAGLRYEMLPGEWYGPTTSCYVIRDLCTIHQKERKNENMFRVIVAQEGCVYRDVVEETMTVDGCIQKECEYVDLPDHPLDINTNNTSSKDIPWDTSLLLLIPLRLGLKSLPSTYHNQLSQIFTLPQSVGCIGGSPRHALWFYGSILKNKKTQLFALDPHTVQMAPQRDTKRTISLSNEYISSVTCSSPIIIDMEKLDPSLALGFYCKDRNDFDTLQYSLQFINKTNTSMFSIIDSAPDYTCNVSALADMMSRVDDEDGECDSFEEDDEDDYVFL